MAKRTTKRGKRIRPMFSVICHLFISSPSYLFSSLLCSSILLLLSLFPLSLVSACPLLFSSIHFLSALVSHIYLSLPLFLHRMPQVPPPKEREHSSRSLYPHRVFSSVERDRHLMMERYLWQVPSHVLRLWIGRRMNRGVMKAILINYRLWLSQ